MSIVVECFSCLSSKYGSRPRINISLTCQIDFWFPVSVSRYGCILHIFMLEFLYIPSPCFTNTIFTTTLTDLSRDHTSIQIVWQSKTGLPQSRETLQQSLAATVLVKLWHLMCIPLPSSTGISENRRLTSVEHDCVNCNQFLAGICLKILIKCIWFEWIIILTYGIMYLLKYVKRYVASVSL